ncbi:type IV pilin [Salarchaeum japonicum]|uniref:type IV pilin n=1 Tax=Salarchaeum japonicum TaxID=555573 RepID=UPI003C748FE9
MKLEIPSIDADERGVSPVIGVILMVAITVILAAVIGAFVLNLGNDIQNTAPTASIGATDAGQQLNSTGDQTVLYINHQQGDSIKQSNLRITVSNESGAQIADITWNTTKGSWDAGTNSNLNVSSGALSDSSFDAGDQLTLKEVSGTNVTAGQTLTVQIIDTESGSTVATPTVRVE